MILSGEKELNKQIKAGLPTGVYLLYGSDRSLVERYCTLLADRAVTGRGPSTTSEWMAAGSTLTASMTVC